MKNFPTRAPVGMLLGTIFGLFSVVPIFAVRHHFQPPLERFYWPQYLGSTLAQTPVGTVLSFFHAMQKTRTYFVLLQKGRPVTGAIGIDPARPVSVRSIETTPRIFGSWLGTQIYGGHNVAELLRTPLLFWASIALSLFLCGLAWDFHRRRRAREGVPLRGPELLSRRDFNRVTQGDGFTLHVHD
jgi:hypothetical protein